MRSAKNSGNQSQGLKIAVEFGAFCARLVRQNRSGCCVPPRADYGWMDGGFRHEMNVSLAPIRPATSDRCGTVESANRTRPKAAGKIRDRRDGLGDARIIHGCRYRSIPKWGGLRILMLAPAKHQNEGRSGPEKPKGGLAINAKTRKLDLHARARIVRSPRRSSVYIALSAPADRGSESGPTP